MAKVQSLGSPFKTPTKAKKKGLDKLDATQEASESVASDTIAETKVVADPTRQLSSGISAFRPVRSEESFHTPERQIKAFDVQDVQDKLEMPGAQYGKSRAPEPICLAVNREQTSPLMHRALRHGKLPTHRLMSRVKQKLQFGGSRRSRKRVMASECSVRHKSSTTKTTNWWDM
ncbi:hypothetical protein AnigIFM63604_003318 [Aspergillus niger]|uniref:Uncharacterized protein n=2 Tax=Aspergillus subgen. Circumdati TaxID=2720871 RepID=A0A9W6ACS9_ASPNG|nr:hypothetical protein BO88DRAFT_408805 [Aspergillus vadensis CBS 113365]PYH63945.1 hypothetical protein BO88DRAFT_408805 [Aspergillus vadensis CBS 113365]GKZ98313.1 hypothetical protein AnigIFM59636_002720 [Aspergillus niger]GLA55970.1 hypothetical protein AnigIFM63604_003318 [Aspergillus niger]